MKVAFQSYSSSKFNFICITPELSPIRTRLAQIVYICDRIGMIGLERLVGRHSAKGIESLRDKWTCRYRLKYSPAIRRPASCSSLLSSGVARHTQTTQLLPTLINLICKLLSASPCATRCAVQRWAERKAYNERSELARAAVIRFSLERFVRAEERTTELKPAPRTKKNATIRL